jgi:hypothetical protein
VVSSGGFIAYYRVSTGKQGKSGLGIEAQRQAVAAYLNGGNWRIIAEFTEIESGRRSDRPALEKALAAARVHGLHSGGDVWPHTGREMALRRKGYVTINKAISITGLSTTGVLATSGVSGITINAGANDTINLQGLDIDGAGSGANGIQFNTGASLNVRNSVIRGFSNGITFQPNGSSTLSVGSTLISNNSTGISFQNSAISTGILNDLQLVNNGTGIVALGTSSTAPAAVTIASDAGWSLGGHKGNHRAATAYACGTQQRELPPRR